MVINRFVIINNQSALFLCFIFIPKTRYAFLCSSVNLKFQYASKRIPVHLSCTSRQNWSFFNRLMFLPTDFGEREITSFISSYQTKKTLGLSLRFQNSNTWVQYGANITAKNCKFIIYLAVPSFCMRGVLLTLIINEHVSPSFQITSQFVMLLGV